MPSRSNQANRLGWPGRTRAMVTPSRTSRATARSRDLSTAITDTASTPGPRASSRYRFHTRTVWPMRGGQTLLSTTPWMRMPPLRGPARAERPGPPDAGAEDDPGRDGERSRRQRALAHRHDGDGQAERPQPGPERARRAAHAEQRRQREERAERDEGERPEVEPLPGEVAGEVRRSPRVAQEQPPPGGEPAPPAPLELGQAPPRRTGGVTRRPHRGQPPGDR